MEIFVDPSQRRGLAKAVFEQLRQAIVTGRLRHGDRLPPSRELADQLGVSRHTVTTAYGRLVAEGYLDGRSGGGTRVSYASDTAPGEAKSAKLRPRPIPDADYVTGPPSAGGVDLRIGLPDRGLYPVEAWRRCVVTALQVAPIAGGEPSGHHDLRRALAHWVGRSRGVDVDGADIVVTCGAQHAVDLAVRSLVSPGEVVAFEEPGYAPVRDLFRSSGYEVVPVPVDDNGLIVDAIPPAARLVYTTPSHQSPMGSTMSLSRRRALLDLAARREMAIIEDDYDSEYRHSDRPLEPLYRLDDAGSVVYIGTFSKSLSPTLRLGFAALPRSLTRAVSKIAELSGAYPPTLVQTAMYHFITEGHLDRHLRKARRAYGERHAIVDGFVREMVAQGVLLPGPTSHTGLHMSARLPQAVSERDVIEHARARNVALTAVEPSWMGPPRWPALLLGFGRAGRTELDRGLGAVRDVLVRLSRS